MRPMRSDALWKRPSGFLQARELTDAYEDEAAGAVRIPEPPVMIAQCRLCATRGARGGRQGGVYGGMFQDAAPVVSLTTEISVVSRESRLATCVNN